VVIVASLIALMALSCGAATERVLLEQFFAASRLRDLTALGKFSTVVFEPATDGIITNFEMTNVVDRGATKEVTISAPVRMFDGRTVTKNFVVTVERGRVTAISERSAAASTPPR
jgi:predicted RNA-binding protein with TRAM domain